MYILKDVCGFTSLTGGFHLVGRVYNHTSYDDRTLITTSRVVNCARPTKDSIICTTKTGSLYTFTTKDIDKLSNEKLNEIK